MGSARQQRVRGCNRQHSLDDDSDNDDDDDGVATDDSVDARDAADDGAASTLALWLLRLFSTTSFIAA